MLSFLNKSKGQTFTLKELLDVLVVGQMEAKKDERARIKRIIKKSGIKTRTCYGKFFHRAINSMEFELLENI